MTSIIKRGMSLVAHCLPMVLLRQGPAIESGSLLSHLNPLVLRAAKTGLTILLIFSFLTKAFLSKIFKGEMFIRILPTTLLQIFCENLLYFQVILKSMKIADDTFLGNSECEWVNATFHRKDKMCISRHYSALL